jgi:hypothetical protein
LSLLLLLLSNVASLGTAGKEYTLSALQNNFAISQLDEMISLLFRFNFAFISLLLAVVYCASETWPSLDFQPHCSAGDAQRWPCVVARQASVTKKGPLGY